MRKPKPKKEPGILRRLLDAWIEMAKYRKAVRILGSQSWGVDFLVMVLCKAREYGVKDVEFRLKSPSGQELRIVHNSVPNKLGEEEQRVVNMQDGAIAKVMLDSIYRQGRV